MVLGSLLEIAAPGLRALYVVEKCMVPGFGIDFGTGFGIENVLEENS